MTLVVAALDVGTEVPASAMTLVDTLEAIYPASYQLVECNSFAVFFIESQKNVFLLL